jgi:glutamate-ammonia-ligase adenylyltransferase
LTGSGAGLAKLRFKLGVQLIEASHRPQSEIAQGLSRVAEAALAVLAQAATAEFERVHGRVAGGDLLILGYGRHGRRRADPCL